MCGSVCGQLPLTGFWTFTLKHITITTGAPASRPSHTFSAASGQGERGHPWLIPAVFTLRYLCGGDSRNKNPKLNRKSVTEARLPPEETYLFKTITDLNYTLFWNTSVQPDINWSNLLCSNVLREIFDWKFKLKNRIVTKHVSTAPSLSAYVIRKQ